MYNLALCVLLPSVFSNVKSSSQVKATSWSGSFAPAVLIQPKRGLTDLGSSSR